MRARSPVLDVNYTTECGLWHEHVGWAKRSVPTIVVGNGRPPTLQGYTLARSFSAVLTSATPGESSTLSTITTPSSTSMA